MTLATFTPGKTYTTRSICDHDCIIRGTVEGVHADRLAAVFTEQTGFDTHM